MTETLVLYLRITQQNKDYLDECAADAGISTSRVADAIIEGARRRGWTVSPAVGAQIREPE